MINDITYAAKLISNGELVAFPTETVYGLGADANNQEACLKIYKLKNRPVINPLIVHISTIAAARNLGIWNEAAEKLTNEFWPGPLSIVLKLLPNSGICSCATAGLSTIALRMPAHKVALELISKSMRPIAAPSANPSGYISPTTRDHVLEHFSDLYVLQGSNSEYGLESTIVDLSSDEPTVLRYGFITEEALSKALGTRVKYTSSTELIKAPGSLEKHYAPKAKVRLNALHLNKGEVGLGFGDIDLSGINLSKTGDLVEAAQGLYRCLRKLDEYAKVIAIAPIPNHGIGLAINDRLKRASL